MGDFDGWTLEEAKEWLRQQIYEGAPCPCCTQRAQMYERTIHWGMVKGLRDLIAKGGVNGRYVKRPCVEDDAKLRYWGLIDNTDQKAGWWTATDLGVRWLNGEQPVPASAWVFDNRLCAVNGPPFWVSEVKGFDLSALFP